MPKRIQRQRTKGWRMPEGAVYVGRPTKFGNDWTMRDAADRGQRDPRKQREFAVMRYRCDIENWIQWEPFRSEVASLRGKDLACWCPLDQPCHADVLLEIANPVAQETERGH